MSWVAVRPDHAIERVRVEVNFADALPKKIVESAGRKFDALRHEIRFNSRSERQVTNIVIGNSQNTPAQNQQIGWQAFRELRPNVVAEGLILDTHQLIYETSEYTSWSKAEKRFKKIGGEILTSLVDISDLKSFSLDYTDRFVYNGPPEESSPTPLLNANITNILSDTAKDGSRLWHLHRGWFVIRNGKNFLINQNLDAQEGKSSSGAPVRSLQLYTRTELRPLGAGLEQGSIDDLLNDLHVCCNEQFKAALSELAMKLVGMDVND